MKNINKKYPNGFHAVVEVNLEIADKEFIVLVGPSGCGKSTLLRMVAGLEEISSGEMYIDGKLVNDVSPKERDIAMVFQNYALYPHMSIFDNMAFGLKLRKMPKEEIEKSVNNAASILGLEKLLDRKPKEMSGGQRQRVALGRAIVRQPKVFLMDEPLSNLDAKLRVQTRAELSKLHQKLETTFIYVTHDQTEAMTMGSRIVVLKDGVVQQVDSPTNLYERPRNVFVAGFIGSPQMNFIEARLTEKNGKMVATYAGGETEMMPEKAALIKEQNYTGRDVLIGIRPERISVELSGDKDKNKALVDKALVEVTERLGSETYLFLSIKGNNIIARVNPELNFMVDDNVYFTFEKEHLHVFDKETEAALF